MVLDTAVSDADLIEQSLREPELFTAIFDRHAGEILRYVHARLGADLAEDVAAETFLAAFRCRDRFDLHRIRVRTRRELGGRNPMNEELGNE